MSRLLLLALLSVLPLLGLAQTNTNFKLKDGAYRDNNVVMRLQAGQAFRLEGPLTFNDGSVLKPTGILVRKDGTRELLPNGKAVNQQGVIVNLRDDMQTAQSIEQRNREVAGGRGEVNITLPSSSAAPATMQQLQVLERRVALLQQLTDKLADRTAQAVGARPEAAPLDEQLRSMDAQRQP